MSNIIFKHLFFIHIFIYISSDVSSNDSNAATARDTLENRGMSERGVESGRGIGGYGRGRGSDTLKKRMKIKERKILKQQNKK